MNPIATFIASSLLNRFSDYKASHVTVSGGGIDGLMTSCERMLWSTKKYKSISVNIIESVTDRGPGLNTICRMVKTLGQTSKKVVY